MDGADKYREILIEIKNRTAVIDAFLLEQASAIYRTTTLESTSLQVRKILELIAFSSLIANIRVYSAQYRRFSEHWNARIMLKDMARVNSQFYPRPIIQKPSSTPGIVMDWIDREGDFLDKEEFVAIYEKCGGILHTDNPYGSTTDYSYYETNLPKWRNKIVNLLNAHTISLVDDTNLYLFQMGDKDSNPSYTPFGLVGTAK